MDSPWICVSCSAKNSSRRDHCYVCAYEDIAKLHALDAWRGGSALQNAQRSVKIRPSVVYPECELPLIPVAVHESITTCLHALPAVRARRAAAEARAEQLAAAAAERERERIKAEEEEWEREKEAREAYYAEKAALVAAEAAVLKSNESGMDAREGTGGGREGAHAISASTERPRGKQAVNVDDSGDSYESSSDEDARARKRRAVAGTSAGGGAAKKRDKGERRGPERARGGQGEESAGGSGAARPAQVSLQARLLFTPLAARLPVFIPTDYGVMVSIAEKGLSEPARAAAVKFLTGTLLTITAQQLVRRGGRSAAAAIGALSESTDPRLQRSRQLGGFLEKYIDKMTVSRTAEAIQTKLKGMEEDVAAKAKAAEATRVALLAVPKVVRGVVFAEEGGDEDDDEEEEVQVLPEEPKAVVDPKPAVSTVHVASSPPSAATVMAAAKVALCVRHIPSAVTNYIGAVEKMGAVLRQPVCVEVVMGGVEGRMDAQGFTRVVLDRLAKLKLPPMPPPRLQPPPREERLPVAPSPRKPRMEAAKSISHAAPASVGGDLHASVSIQKRGSGGPRGRPATGAGKGRGLGTAGKLLKLKREHDDEKGGYSDVSVVSSEDENDDIIMLPSPTRPKSSTAVSGKGRGRPSQGRGASSASPHGGSFHGGKPLKIKLAIARQSVSSSQAKPKQKNKVKDKAPSQVQVKARDDEVVVEVKQEGDGSGSEASWELPEEYRINPEAARAALAALRAGDNKEEVAAWAPQGMEAGDVEELFERQLRRVAALQAEETYSDEEEVVHGDDGEEEEEVDMARDLDGAGGEGRGGASEALGHSGEGYGEDDDLDAILQGVVGQGGGEFDDVLNMDVAMPGALPSGAGAAFDLDMDLGLGMPFGGDEGGELGLDSTGFNLDEVLAGL